MADWLSVRFYFMDDTLVYDGDSPNTMGVEPPRATTGGWTNTLVDTPNFIVNEFVSPVDVLTIHAGNRFTYNREIAVFIKDT